MSRYGLALLSIVLATVLRVPLVYGFGIQSPYAAYLVAVWVTAWLCGLGPALAATGLGVLAGGLLSVGVSPPHPVAWAMVYVLSSLTGIAIVEAQRRAQCLAEERLQKLWAAEEARERQRLVSEQTLASIGDAVIATDAQGRIQFLNAVAESLTGWQREEAVHQPLERVFNIINEQTQSAVDNPVRQVIREGAVLGLANHTVLISKDGRRIPIDDSAAPIRGDGGKIFGAVLVFRDITQRRRAERELRESESRLRAFLESASQGILVADSSGKILLVNAKTEDLFGYTRDELLGRPLEMLLPERFRGTHVAHRADYFAHPRARPMGSGMDLAGRKKNGMEFPLEISLSFTQEGDTVRALAFITDITDRKRIEEQLRQTAKLESLGVLAGGVAHDFNNLLTGVIGNASLALEIAGTEAQAPLRQVLQSSEKAANLTRQLLAYSGKGRFVIECVILSELIREMRGLLESSISRSVELRLELDDTLPPVECDPTQMQQLIMNLVTNGAEAVGEVAGSVTVRTEPREGQVCLEVSDTGSGMDDATKEKIFDPFFTTKFLGRGLGLAAALGIVRGHHGDIRVESTPGRGSTFIVLLPVARGSVPRLDSPPLGDLNGDGTILVVDDEETVRRTAKMTLERYGYRVLLANNGQAAVEAMQRSASEVSVILLDLTMPVISGEEALPRLQEIRADVPVILSSGYNEADAVRRFHGLGLAGFLQKPYTSAQLAQAVKRVRGRAKPKHMQAT